MLAQLPLPLNTKSGSGNCNLVFHDVQGAGAEHYNTLGSTMDALLQEHTSFIEEI